MKKNLRGFAFAMACLILLTTSAVAESEPISPHASEYINGTSADIVAESNGHLRIYFSVGATDIMSELGATVIYVYENDGNSTRVVATLRCTQDEYSYFMAENTAFHGGNVVYKGIVGYKYYAKVYLKAGDSTGSDTLTHTTATVTAKRH